MELGHGRQVSRAGPRLVGAFHDQNLEPMDVQLAPQTVEGLEGGGIRARWLNEQDVPCLGQ